MLVGDLSVTNEFINFNESNLNLLGDENKLVANDAKDKDKDVIQKQAELL